MLRPLILAATAAVLHAPVGAQSQPVSLFNGADLLGQEPSPLFASHEPLNLRLVADFDEITDDRSQDSEEGDGTAIVTTPDGSSFTVPVQIRTRGNFRLQSWVCPFPPLRLDFPKEEVGGSVLSGQDKLKMVTHCRDRDRYEQNILKEFLVYRFFNQLTDRSFQVRLARVTYVDTGSRGQPVTRWGFLIEDEDQMAARLGGEILEVEELHPARILGVNAATVTIFQFMVGNTDFSLYRDHNMKLVQTADDGVIAVPYDFDWTGLVDSPYAIPDPTVGSRSVRQRIFRGLCRPGVDYAEHYRRFREVREAIEALVVSQPGLTQETAEDVLDYLNEFYEIVGDEKAAREDIEEECRPV